MGLTTSSLGCRYIIIGTSAAGIAAAESIRDRGHGRNLTLIGEEAHGFYSRPGLAYYLTGEVSEQQLILHQASSFRRIRERAVAIDPEAHRVALADGSSLDYDRLLIATGALAAPAAVPGSNLTGVVKLDNLDDARRIAKAARRSRTGVVIGGGITAIEIVEALAARGVETHYLLRGDRYWHNVLDETESMIVERSLAGEGVHLHHNTRLARIMGKRGNVRAVETTDGEQLDCQVVGVAIGVRPRLELAATAGLATDRGILTDEYLETSARDIFAAGDVAQVFDPWCGRAVLDTLWGAAVAQGRVAGRNMAGERTCYHKAVPFNVTRLAGLTTTIIGTVGDGSEDAPVICRGESEAWRHLPRGAAVQRDVAFSRTRILVGPKRMTGAVVMGDQTLSRPLHALIAGLADTAPILDSLLDPHAPVADIIVGFWRQWSHAHAT